MPIRRHPGGTATGGTLSKEQARPVLASARQVGNDERNENRYQLPATVTLALLAYAGLSPLVPQITLPVVVAVFSAPPIAGTQFAVAIVITLI